MTRCYGGGDAHPFLVEDDTGAHCPEHGITLLWHGDHVATEQTASGVQGARHRVGMVTVMCPYCRTPMADVGSDCWACITCPRTAHTGEKPAEIEQRETNRLDAIALLNAALAHQDERGQHDRQVTDEMEARMGQTIQTRGCSKCGGTMYRTVETDVQGNPTSASLYICNGCGHMEG
ncbi:hypothetical protein [Streptomyces sp. NPDC051657]|uniref:hypothetical protein n=1 Tax=unclassified Streptomyces TaxID=2593676 RepID=UPI0034137A02